MTTTLSFRLLAAVLVTASVAGCMNMNRSMAGDAMSAGDVEQMIASWPEASRMAAMTAMEEYGAPDGVTPMMLTWQDTPPFKRTLVYRDPVQHNFPAPHPDVMEQVIDYQVPPEMFDELAAYDGSVIVERTKGEMSARCDKIGANLLALNLAHEIVTGVKTVEQARMAYGEQIMAMKNGQPAPYTERLMFTPPARTQDPDRPLQ